MTSYDFNSYAPTLTGTGASGTWPISITGTFGGRASDRHRPAARSREPIPTPSLNTNAIYPVTAGNGNGINFWNSGSYAITMGNGALYDYGGVTDYSIKTTMDGTAGRGFTWGVVGAAPTASLTETGAMSLTQSLTIGASGGLNSTPATYGTIGLMNAQSGYYGVLFGQSTANPNLMYDGSGNGGVYYQSTGYWATGTL